MKNWTTIVLSLFITSISFSQTVNKPYNPGSSTSVDGCGVYCDIFPAVNFTQADFTDGCEVTDVNVTIIWAKTDGTCSAPLAGDSNHDQTNFRLDGPSGNEILVAPGTYTGQATMSAVSTTFDQQASMLVGGAVPVSGNFIPNNGNLNNYNGTSAFGDWEVKPGDLITGDPLCISSYSVTITTTADVTAPTFTVCPSDQNEYLDASCELTVPDYTGLVTVSELCGYTLTQSPAAGTTISTSGVSVVTITATDSYGNSSDCQFNLNALDTISVGISLSGATLTADNAAANGYQWLDCDNNYAQVSGETGTSFTPTVTGNYALEITEAGCVDTSACILVDFTSITDVASGININIFPNPSDGIFNVELNGLNNDQFELRIVDVQGRIIVSENFNGVNTSVIKSIDISESEDGIYVIQLIGDKGILLTKQIVKQ